MEPGEVDRSKAAFKQSYERFLGSLPQDDAKRFERCSDPDGVREALIAMRGKVKASEDKTLTRWLGVFDRLNRKLQQYFDAVNVAIGTNDCAAMVYGCIRLVILLAGALPSFIDKFVAIMSLLIDSFPQYLSISSIFVGGIPERLQLHLERVFDDFFECLRISARVFVSSTGRIKRPIQLMATAIWKPFDTQFGNLMDRMRAHQQYILLELEIFQTTQMSKQADYTLKDTQLRDAQMALLEELRRLHEADSHGQLKENHKAAASRILRWLNPSTFAQTFEDSREVRREGTSQWFLDYEEFKDWRATATSTIGRPNPRTFPSTVLWISGNPGCGKTILASGIIDFLSQSDTSGHDASQVAYFFFSHLHEHARTVDAAYRAILAQLLEKNRDNEGLLDKFLFFRYRESNTSGQQVATRGDLLNLLKVISSEIGPFHIVLDGIDETDNADEVSRRLKELANTAPIKIICLSRPNIDFLLRQVSPSRRIDFDRQTSNADIELVATGIVEEMIREALLPDVAPTLNLVKFLVLGADGMFLWIKLMSMFLKSPAFTPSRRVRIIQDVGRPEGLDAMYDRIAALIAHTSAHERELASRILTWVRFAKEECTEEMLLKGAFEDIENPETPSDLSWMALAICGGLVEYTHRKTFKFIHLTVKEYLDSEPWLRLGISTPLLPSRSFATATIVRRCFHHLLSQAPPSQPRRSFERPTNEDKVMFNASFESYVARHWEHHLATLSPPLLIQLHNEPIGHQLYQSIHEFVSNPLAVGHWLHCLYRGLQNYDFMMPDLESWLHAITSSSSSYGLGLDEIEVLQQLVQQLGGMRDEVNTINEEWGDRLFEMPSLLWDDVLMFQKQGILAEIPDANKEPQGHQVHILEPELPKTHQNCEMRLLGSVSRTASNSRFLGVLSVYSPSSMEHFWDMMEDTPDSYETIEQFSTGWTAVYETWTTSSHSRSGTISLCIPPTQIILLLRQSFRRVFGPGGSEQIDDLLVPDEIETFRDRFKLDDKGKGQETHCSCSSTASTSQKIADMSSNVQGDESHERFRLSFPMSISHDCQSFSVLRGVYWVRCDDSGKFSEHNTESDDLPLQSLPHYKSRWTEDLQPLHGLFGRSYFRNSLDWAVAQNTYTYSVTFDADGRNILFADYQRPCSSYLLIFRVGTGRRSRISLFRSIKLTLPMGLLTQPIFNDSKPLLAFILGGEVRTWEYQYENAEPEKVDMKGKGFRSVKSIAFSDCNDYILMNDDFGSIRVVRVSDCLKQQSCAVTAPGLLSVAAPLPPPTALKKNQLVDIGSFVMTNMRLGQVFTDMALVSSGPDQSQSLVLGISTSQNSIRLGTLGESRSSLTQPSLHLLSTPKSFNLDNTSVSLLAPLHHGQSPQIVFNKVPSGDYIVSKRKREQHPSILSRNLTSVFQVIDTSDSTTQLEQPMKKSKHKARKRGEIHEPGFYPNLLDSPTEG